MKILMINQPVKILKLSLWQCFISGIVATICFYGVLRSETIWIQAMNAACGAWNIIAFKLELDKINKAIRAAVKPDET